MLVLEDVPATLRYVESVFTERKRKIDTEKNIRLVFLWNRCLVLRFGKPKDRACAAKKVENEWLLCLWIVQMLLQTNQESER